MRIDLDSDAAELIRIAERYPFERPTDSYVFRSEPGARLEEDWRERRSPVLATGANAAPARLAVKFPTGGHAIPVTRARLAGLAVVHAGHFARYGALPATLHPDPGVVSEIFVTWLSGPQLAHMHRTEGVGVRYGYEVLAGVQLQVDAVGAVTTAGAYLSLHGSFAPAGAPVRLAAIPARGSSLPQAEQRPMLERAHRLLAADLAYATFMGRIIGSDCYRRQQTRALHGHALPWPGPRPATGQSCPGSP